MLSNGSKQKIMTNSTFKRFFKVYFLYSSINYDNTLFFYSFLKCHVNWKQVQTHFLDKRLTRKTTPNRGQFTSQKLKCPNLFLTRKYSLFHWTKWRKKITWNCKVAKKRCTTKIQCHQESTFVPLGTFLPKVVVQGTFQSPFLMFLLHILIKLRFLAPSSSKCPLLLYCIWNLKRYVLILMSQTFAMLFLSYLHHFCKWQHFA